MYVCMYVCMCMLLIYVVNLVKISSVEASVGVGYLPFALSHATTPLALVDNALVLSILVVVVVVGMLLVLLLLWWDQ